MVKTFEFCIPTARAAARAGPDCPSSPQEARIRKSSIFLPFCS